ncbi:helicase C-terminal domain-containing protein, partial [Halobacterium salinarum]|uniref:helicase C-terminal domain-containing protein n=1 Tax=Halobacterium salinarum TaxID=2242 RepID=UPI002E1CCD84
QSASEERPFNVYKDVVGLDYLDHQHDRPVKTAELVKKFPEENQASFIVDAPKFTSRKRGETDEWNDVRKQYARVILSVARTPGNILVCMPSYPEAKWAGEILRETNQFEKDVLIDKSSSNDETEELKEEFFAGEGKILTTSIRGTLTEGVDYRGDRLHGVVVVGVPIPNMGSPRVRALQHSYELEYGSLGFPYSMFVPAVRKARQALGRVIRGEDDVGVRVLVDERYASSGQGAVRQYLSDHEQQRYDVTDPASLQGKIEAFWQNQNAF